MKEQLAYGDLHIRVDRDFLCQKGYVTNYDDHNESSYKLGEFVSVPLFKHLRHITRLSALAFVSMCMLEAMAIEQPTLIKKY